MLECSSQKLKEMQEIMRNKKFYILIILGMVVSVNMNAQCAMCKAALEANIDAGGTKGIGINEAIMYLIPAPYLAVLIIGFFWYLQSKKITFLMLFSMLFNKKKDLPT